MVASPGYVFVKNNTVKVRKVSLSKMESIQGASLHEEDVQRDDGRSKLSDNLHLKPDDDGQDKLQSND